MVGWSIYSLYKLIWSFEQLLANIITYLGGILFLLTYASINFIITEYVLCILPFKSLYYSNFEQIELNVELTVATPANMFLFLHLPLSNAINITLSIFKAESGTHKVLPLFAISCNSIFVPILLKPFFFKVPSVAIWHTILF